MIKKINEKGITKPNLIKKYLANQKMLDSVKLKQDILQSCNKLLSLKRNEIGLIDLTEALSKNVFIPIIYKQKNILLALVDRETGLVYRFKYNKNSDIVKFCRKELYATLIGRMIAKIGNTVDYFPACFNGERGVISLDWGNLGKCYEPLSRAKVFESLSDFDSYEYLEDDFTEDAIEKIRKVPQHFLAGNADFLDRNIGVKRNKINQVDDVLYYDYGFSNYSVIEGKLYDKSLAINEKNILDVYRSEFLLGGGSIGMGATYNLGYFLDTKEFVEDFAYYAYYNDQFKQNIKDSLLIYTDKAVKEEIKKMRSEGFKFYDENETLVRTILDENTRLYEYCL